MTQSNDRAFIALYGPSPEQFHEHTDVQTKRSITETLHTELDARFTEKEIKSVWILNEKDGQAVMKEDMQNYRTPTVTYVVVEGVTSEEVDSIDVENITLSVHRRCPSIVESVALLVGERAINVSEWYSSVNGEE